MYEAKDLKTGKKSPNARESGRFTVMTSGLNAQDISHFVIKSCGVASRADQAFSWSESGHFPQKNGPE
jgi:hypothetical protein